jgi:hypothetical protein
MVAATAMASAAVGAAAVALCQNGLASERQGESESRYRTLELHELLLAASGGPAAAALDQHTDLEGAVASPMIRQGGEVPAGLDLPAAR